MIFWGKRHANGRTSRDVRKTVTPDDKRRLITTSGDDYRRRTTTRKALTEQEVVEQWDGRGGGGENGYGRQRPTTNDGSITCYRGGPLIERFAVFGDRRAKKNLPKYSFRRSEVVTDERLAHRKIDKTTLRFQLVFQSVFRLCFVTDLNANRLSSILRACQIV